MSPFMAIIIMIVATVLARAVLRRINRNTFGTTGAYIRRAVFVWMICLYVVGFVCTRLGLL